MRILLAMFSTGICFESQQQSPSENKDNTHFTRNLSLSPARFKKVIVLAEEAHLLFVIFDLDCFKDSTNTYNEQCK